MISLKKVIKLIKIHMDRKDDIVFKDILSKDKIKIVENVSDWKEAVNLSVGLLEKDGIVPSDYKTKVIESVNELGPYIFIAPGIAMPHVQYFGETEVGISLLRINREVSYDNEKSADLFFAFSAKDSKSHIKMIQELASFLFDDKNIEALRSKKTTEEIYDYIQAYG